MWWAEIRTGVCRDHAPHVLGIAILYDLSELVLLSNLSDASRQIGPYISCNGRMISITKKVLLAKTHMMRL
jgi:hypothetical protein